MTMSQQQLRNLGLAHVRKAVASGKYTSADVKRWKAELGTEPVQKILAAYEPEPPAKTESKPATAKKE